MGNNIILFTPRDEHSPGEHPTELCLFVSNRQNCPLWLQADEERFFQKMFNRVQW